MELILTIYCINNKIGNYYLDLTLTLYSVTDPMRNRPEPVYPGLLCIDPRPGPFYIRSRTPLQFRIGRRYYLTSYRLFSRKDLPKKGRILKVFKEV